MKPVPETILVVDDDKTNRNLLSIILKKEGYRVIEAEDGQDALTKSLETLVDLVLLDIMMPNRKYLYESVQGNLRVAKISDRQS